MDPHLVADRLSLLEDRLWAAEVHLERMREERVEAERLERRAIKRVGEARGAFGALAAEVRDASH